MTAGRFNKVLFLEFLGKKSYINYLTGEYTNTTKIANIKFQVSTFKQHSNFKLNKIEKKIIFKLQQKSTKTSFVANNIFF